MKKTIATSPVYPANDDKHPFTPSEEFEDGLTKREYFAALAMQGLNANPDFTDDRMSDIAEWAVGQADYLIDALNKREGE